MPTAATGATGTVPAMLVMSLEYWPGADAGGAQPRGWAAVLRLATTTGRPPWLVVTVLAGRRTAHRVPADSAAGALTAVLAHRSTAVQPVAAAAEQDQAAVAQITRIVETARDSRRGWLAAPLPGRLVSPRLDDGRLGIRKQVLLLPMLTEPEVQSLFTRERDRPAIVRGLRKAGVIVAVPGERGRLYPAFQFRGARPHPVVAGVNLLLHADQRPWRAATWWVRQHAQLGCRPLDLLAREEERDGLLLAAELASDDRGAAPLDDPLGDATL